MSRGRVRVACAVTTVALTLAACGSHSPGGPDVSWVQVAERTSCEAVNPSYCVGYYGFTVTSDGRYSAGPADDGTRLEGSLSDSERTAIASDAARLTASLGVAQVCDASGALPGVGDAVELTDSRGVVTRVYDLGLTTCYRGGRARAIELHDELAALMARYYPRPFPR